eukprot:TRINITY_DN3634_c0_g1_i1.p1 TRINITY_DN3634_c0_g1~~TRINITY_DN3634_c0_g1_i1.p1  ORF type:complete len:123 (+),score=8.97 TRINITY_DN3634_c0_g1_i1:42-410(+)
MSHNARVNDGILNSFNGDSRNQLYRAFVPCFQTWWDACIRQNIRNAYVLFIQRERCNRRPMSRFMINRPRLCCSRTQIVCIDRIALVYYLVYRRKSSSSLCKLWRPGAIPGYRIHSGFTTDM